MKRAVLITYLTIISSTLFGGFKDSIKPLANQNIMLQTQNQTKTPQHCLVTYDATLKELKDIINYSDNQFRIEFFKNLQKPLKLNHQINKKSNKANNSALSSETQKTPLLQHLYQTCSSEIIQKLSIIDNAGILSLLYGWKYRIPHNNNTIIKIYNETFAKLAILLEYLQQQYPLHKACKDGKEEIISFLIKLGIDVHKENNEGLTLLFTACKTGHERIVQYLIEHGSDVNKQNNIGLTPLFVACAYNNENIVKYLVEHGSDINKSNNIGLTPLFIACTNGNENIVKYLVEHGTNINKKDIYGTTPLFLACKYGHENIVKYLVEHGADVNQENEFKETPLFSACANQNKYIVQYLLIHHANIYAINIFGTTPLGVAIINGNVDIVNYLTEQGANLNTESSAIKIAHTVLTNSTQYIHILHE